MGKYSTVTKQAPKPRNRGVHPVMRGIGCILIVLVPIIAYGASFPLISLWLSLGWPIPRSWFGPIPIHPLLRKVQGLQSVLFYLQGINGLTVHIVFTLVIIAVIGIFLTLVYGYIYNIFGPPKYGPQDAPPIRKKIKAYKR